MTNETKAEWSFNLEQFNELLGENGNNPVTQDKWVMIVENWSRWCDTAMDLLYENLIDAYQSETGETLGDSYE